VSDHTPPGDGLPPPPPVPADAPQGASAPPSATRRLVREAALAAAVAALAALPFALWLTRVPSLAGRDTARLYAPLRSLVVEALRDWRLPLWNPYEGTGKPLLAEGLHGALHPLSILLAWIAPASIDALLLAYLAAARITGPVRRLVGLVEQTELRQQAFAFGDDGRVVAHRLPPAAGRAQRAGDGQRQALQRGQRTEELVDLKGAHQAECDAAVRRQPGDIAAMQQHRAGNHLPEAEPALDAPAHQRAQDAAHAAGAEDETDLGRAGTHLLRHHDQQQGHRRLHEVQAARQQRHLAHDPFVPQPAQTRHDFGAQVARREAYSAYAAAPARRNATQRLGVLQRHHSQRLLPLSCRSMTPLPSGRFGEGGGRRSRSAMLSNPLTRLITSEPTTAGQSP